MATIQELLNQAVDIRDADQEQENTATRVGGLLVSIIEHIAGDAELSATIAGYFQDGKLKDSVLPSSAATDAELASALAQYFASGKLKDSVLPSALVSVIENLPSTYTQLGDDGRLLKSQVPVMVLASMGDGYDPSELLYNPASGDTYLSGSTLWYMDGPTSRNMGAPSKNLLYCNAASNTLYRWNGSQFVAVSNPGGGSTANFTAIINNIEVVNGKLNVLIGALANIAFNQLPKPSASELDWDSTKHTVTLNTSGMSGCSVEGTWPKQVLDGLSAVITVVPASGKILRSVTYRYGSDFTPQTATISNNQAVITIPNVTADITVTITATATDSDLPVLTSPIDGSEIDVGTIANDGTSVTKTVTVKGNNLESAVNLAISGSGFSLSANQVSAADANTGVDVIIIYTDSGTGDGMEKTGTLSVSSAGSEFTQRTVSLKGKKLEPGVVVPVVALAANNDIELSGSLSGETYIGVLSVKSASAATKGLPFRDDVSAVMGGASKVISYNDSTGAITINGVTADVTITAVASVVDGVDFNNNPIRWKEGLYFNGNGSYNNEGDNTVANSDWCISDYIKCDWNNLSIGLFMFGTGQSNIRDHYVIFYDENKQYKTEFSLNKAYRLIDLSSETGIVYFRISMLISKRSTRIVRDITNNRFLLKGSDYDGRYDNLLYGILHTVSDNTPTDYANEKYAVTQALPVNFGASETITFWCGNRAFHTGSTYLYLQLFFYSQDQVDMQYYTEQLSCNATPRSFTNPNDADTLPYASLSIDLEFIDDTYVKVTRNEVDTFYFAGFNVNTNGNS